ncbi:hypothetical protein CEXT_700661 [Caerostris extrusa]|uniref:Uncharacterized protein n=1 Tax=Caerostris extrusa TaxID=172846 RepID=A0AAV4VV66_CAEEX|nr:hypothetical protein CEXT_700661 [Caerostris extrusa]
MEFAEVESIVKFSPSRGKKEVLRRTNFHNAGTSPLIPVERMKKRSMSLHLFPSFIRNKEKDINILHYEGVDDE